MGTFVLSVVVGGLILFFWGGLAQAIFPWGIKSVKTHEDEGRIGERIAETTTNDILFIKRDVAAFIVVKPASYYSMGRYFAIEFVTQMIVSLVITGLLFATEDLEESRRLLVVGLAAAATIFSVDAQYWNWWGFTHRYTLGVAVNRFIGYMLVAFILLNVIIR